MNKNDIFKTQFILWCMNTEKYKLYLYDNHNILSHNRCDYKCFFFNFQKWKIMFLPNLKIVFIFNL